MDNQVYQIKQLVFATQAATLVQAQQYENQLKIHLPQLLSCIEQILHTFDQTTVTYCIPKLEIDLGQFSRLPSHFEWTSLLNQRMQQALKKTWHKQQYTLIQNHATAQAWRLFQHFIQQGAWPWWQGIHSPISLSTLWTELWPTYKTELIALLQTCLKQEYALQRWIYHLSDQQLALLLQTAHKDIPIHLVGLYQQLKDLTQQFPQAWQLPEAESREIYWRLCLKNVFATATPFKATQLMTQLLSYVAIRLQQPYAQVVSQCLKATLKNKTASELTTILQQLVHTQMPGSATSSLDLFTTQLFHLLHLLAIQAQPAVYQLSLQQFIQQAQQLLQQKSLNAQWKKLLQDLQQTLQSILHMLKQPDQDQAITVAIEHAWDLTKKCQNLLTAIKTNTHADTPDPTTHQHKTPTEEYPILHAGIILLHPFLPALFKHCHLLKEQSFTNPQALQTALLLIHFLATDKIDLAEDDDLTLPKLLCGLPIDAPLVLTEKLTASHRQQAETLLLMIRERWTILKNSSIDGIRRAFLQRSGLLRREADLWCLRLEKQGCDALLDKLPWGLTPVKTPWMREHLVVEWR